MRIFLLHYSLRKPNPAYGQLAEALRRRGHDVWIGSPDDEFDLAWHNGQDVVERCMGPGLRTGRPDKRPAFVQNLSFLFRVRRSIRRNLPDVVQVNPAAFPFVGALPFGMPSRIHFVIDWRQVPAPAATGPLQRWKQAVKHVLRAASSRYLFERATFLHEAAAQVLLGSRWMRWATVVPLGVDDQFVKVPPLATSGGAAGKVRFLYIGSLTRIRRLECLLKAAELLQRRTTDFELQLVGPDGAAGHYQAEIRRLGLDNVATVLPPVPYSEIPRIVSGADIALAYVPDEPADWRYQPTLKVLEYRAAGVPIIATDLIPNREEIDHGVNGLLCKNDPAAWADAMGSFIGNVERLHDFRDRAQSMRKCAFTWHDVARMYEGSVYLAAAT
jgi:glycosyltransferase involved in cell wall biosynthesis